MAKRVDDKRRVALLRCESYHHKKLKEAVEKICAAAELGVRSGSTVLLKPNLVTTRGCPGHLACSSPEFVTAVAEWFVDQGARVRIGDSPAFGTARRVMSVCGMAGPLRRLGVEAVNFSKSRQVSLDCGLTVPVAAEALDCDLLVNLPRVKAHSQLYVSLAVKNYFGVVTGMRKALHHAVYGDRANHFESLLVDLLKLFPAGFSLVDGVIAMQGPGHLKGYPYHLHLLGGSFDAVALDTALLNIIGADPGKSQLWVECRNRGMTGTSLNDIDFPLQSPAELAVNDFALPSALKPVTFNPVRILVSACRRLAASVPGD
ncbi:MAG: DUF362 domain-containing protein [Thermodesulfobacteriota bacterium]